MNRVRTPLIVGLVSAVLLVLAFAGATAISFPLWLRYRNAAGLSVARTVAQVGGGLTALGFFVTALLIAGAAAMLPGSRWRKLLLVLPLYLLLFTLAGIIAFVAGIGTAGNFTAVWIGVGALLSIIAVIVAAARLPLGATTARRATTALSATGALSAIAWLGMLASLAIVLTSQPSAAPFGPGAPGGSGGQAAPTASANAPVQSAPGGQGERGPRGPQGSTTPLLIGVGLMTVFGAIELASVLRARRAVASLPSDTAPAAAPAARGQTGQVVFSFAAISIVALAVAQVVPIARDNPPAQTAVQWDSTQTQTLARRACLDCHSNETTWPWYAYVAPGSWLLRNHVSEARSQLNFSELNNIPSFRAADLPQEVAQQIRSGAMPPKDYLLMHPEARLSDAEKQQLIQGLQQSLSASLAK